ncbi:MAG: hypothetical protein HFH90_05945 [Lachnospiraceae bacterium]|nr:hypothetical protein [Lachnospiraceae bacterium]
MLMRARKKGGVTAVHRQRGRPGGVLTGAVCLLAGAERMQDQGRSAAGG